MKSAGGESAIERIGSAASHRARPSARLETACERWAVHRQASRAGGLEHHNARRPGVEVTDALKTRPSSSTPTPVTAPPCPSSVPTQRAPDHSSMRPARPAPTTRRPPLTCSAEGRPEVRIVRRCTVPRHTSTARPRVAARIPACSSPRVEKRWPCTSTGCSRCATTRSASRTRLASARSRSSSCVPPPPRPQR